MARLFGAVATDKIVLGSPAKLDNLVQSGITMVLHEARANTLTGTTAVSGKFVGGTSGGFSFLIEDGRLRLVVGRATAQASYKADASNPMVQDQHEVIGFVWNAGTAVADIYRGPITDPISEVSGYSESATGSGAIGSDAAADHWIGNLSLLDSVPWEGDLGWCVVLHRAATVFSAAEVRQVQQGILTLKAAREAGAAYTRGLAIINDVETAALILEIEADGTITDHSASPVTPTLTGTASGSEDEGWFAPTTFHDDAQAEDIDFAQEQTIYRLTSAGARLRFTTTAQNVKVWVYRNLFAVADADPSGVGLWIDGAWSDWRDTPTVDALNAATFSGLSASSKTLDFISGAQARNTGQSLSTPQKGTFPVLLRFDAAATEVAPTAPLRLLATFGESWFEGFDADPFQQKAVLQQIRLTRNAGVDRVMQCGFGGMHFREWAENAASVTGIVDKLLALGQPAGICIGAGLNDYFGDTWNLSQVKDAIRDVVDEILSRTGATHVFLIAPIKNNNGDGIDNTAPVPWSPEDLRSTFADIASEVANARVTSHNPGPGGDDILVAGDLPDGDHPANSGQDKMYTWLVQILGRYLVPAPTITRRQNYLLRR